MSKSSKSKSRGVIVKKKRTTGTQKEPKPNPRNTNTFYIGMQEVVIEPKKKYQSSYALSLLQEMEPNLFKEDAGLALKLLRKNGISAKSKNVSGVKLNNLLLNFYGHDGENLPISVYSHDAIYEMAKRGNMLIAFIESELQDGPFEAESLKRLIKKDHLLGRHIKRGDFDTVTSILSGRYRTIDPEDYA